MRGKLQSSPFKTPKFLIKSIKCDKGELLAKTEGQPEGLMHVFQKRKNFYREIMHQAAATKVQAPEGTDIRDGVMCLRFCKVARTALSSASGI